MKANKKLKAIYFINLVLALTALSLMSNAQTTQLRSVYNYSDSVMPDQFLYTYTITNAVSYEFWIVQQDSAIDERIVKDENYISLLEIGNENVYYNTEYRIKVRVLYESDTSAWGNEIVFTTIDKQKYEYGKIILRTSSLGAGTISLFDIQINSVPPVFIDGFYELNQKAGVTKIERTYVELLSKLPDLSDIYTLSFNEEFSTDSIISFFTASGNFQYVERIPLFEMSESVNDTFFGDQWHLEDEHLNVSDTWDEVLATNNIVKIAIVDDAVRLDHPDIFNNIYINTAELSNSVVSAILTGYDYNGNIFVDANEFVAYCNFLYSPIANLIDVYNNRNNLPTIYDSIDNDGNLIADDIFGYDVADLDLLAQPDPDNTFYHGTHVSGIAAGVTNNNTGIASLSYNHARIIPVKTKKDSNTSTGGLNSPIAGIKYAISLEPDIINMSFGITTSDQIALQDLITSAAENLGIVFIAATGNFGEFGIEVPSSLNNVVSVGATTESKLIWAYSNYGPDMDFLAPGKDIFSCSSGNTEQYSVHSGTSMACPQVTALWALMKSINPNASFDQIYNCIATTCVIPAQWSTDCRDTTGNTPWGSGIGLHGIIDPYNAILCLKEIPPVASFDYSGELICPETEFSFFSTSGGGLITSEMSVEWTCATPGVVFSDADALSTGITFPDEGIYQIVYTIYDEADEVISQYQQEIVAALPQLEIYNVENYSSCQGYEVPVFLQLNGTPPFSFQYSVDGLPVQLVSNITDNSYVLLINGSESFLTGSAHTIVISNYTDNYCTNSVDEYEISFHMEDCNMCLRNYNNIIEWPKGRFEFYGTTPTMQTVQSVAYSESSCAICDNNGDPLLLIKGDKIYNIILPNPSVVSSSTFGESSKDGSIILPHDSGNPDLYYALVVADQTSVGSIGLKYYMIDVSDPFNFHIIHSEMQENYDAEILTACRISDQNGYWIITNTKFTNTLNLYKLQNNVLSLQGNIDVQHFNMFSHMVFSKDMSLFAIQNSAESTSIYSFNREAGCPIGNRLSLVKTIEHLGLEPKFYEFSPNNEYLYIEALYKIEQFPINETDNDPSFEIDGIFTNLRLGPDNKIYVAKIGISPEMNKICLINSPDEAGESCNYDEDNAYETTIGGCENSLSKRIPETKLDFNITEEISVCTHSLVIDNLTGYPPFTYNWSTGASGSSINNISPGTYSVTVTDAFDCSVSKTIEVDPFELVCNITTIGDICYGSSNSGFIDFSVTGGVAPYNIVLFSGATTISSITLTEEGDTSFIDLAISSYSINVTDINGCSVTENFEIAEASQIGLDLEIINEPCTNQSNGSVDVDVTNAYSPFTYLWSNGDTTAIAVQLPEGNVSLTITDAIGCSATSNLYLTSIIPPLTLSLDFANPCGTLYNGYFDLTISGNATVTEMYWLTPGTEEDWDTVYNQYDLNNLTTEGMYQARVWDEYGCRYYIWGDLDTYDEPDASQPTCSWDTDMGEVTTNWNFSENNGVYSYNSTNWLTNQFGDSIPETNGCFYSLPGGTYTLHHTDEQGCILTETIEIYDPQPLQYDVDAEYYSDSEGNAMFTSIVTVTGEYAPYIYFPNTGYPTIINCTDVDVQVISNAEGQPAEFQLSGAISDCNLNNAPYFRLCSYSTGFLQIECDCIDIYFLEGIEDINDTIHLDTITKPTKCLAAGYGTGSVEFLDISTDMNIYPVFFLNTSTNDTLVWNGDPNEFINFDELGTGTFDIEYWNAFSEVNTIPITIEDAFDTIISGIITTGNYPAYDNQVIAVDGIEIQALASLTFKNCTVYTAFDNYNNISETKWFVNRKGKLVLDLSTVESGCPQKWNGIEVDGTTSYSQTLTSSIGMGPYYSQQGYVIIGGNSEINDAYKAIYLKSGSVANITNSYFFNNQYSVYFDAYTANVPVGSPIPANKSTIRNNEFILDSLLYRTAFTGTDYLQTTQVHIISSGGGLSLLGNRFKYLDNSVSPFSRGNAIYATNSKLTVDVYSTNQSIINGFYRGINVQTGTSTRTPTIRKTKFNNNVFAIQLKNLIAPVIENNSIDSKNLFVCPPGQFCPRPVMTAIYLEACDQYTVKLNSIKNGTYGAYIRNSGKNYNLLYKNDFDSVAYPAIANLRNSDFEQGDPFSGGTGLEMKCNDFNHFGYAISVTGNMQQSQGIVGGTSQQLAGNRFYTPTSSTNTQSEFCVSTSIPVDLNVAYYDYYHHNDLLCLPDKHTPLKVETHNYVLIPYDEYSACPDNQGTKTSTKSTGSIFEQYVEIDDSISQAISNKETELQQIVDNGNTLLLQAIAAGMNNSNYNQVMNDLNLEGMISDNVVLELMQNTLAPSAAKVLTLIENSPLPKAGKDKINEMTDVDENLRVILLQYQDGKNSREIKESEITNLKQEKRRNISQLISYVAYEDDYQLNSNLIDFLESQHTVIDNKTALRFAISNDDYHSADQILTNLQTMAQTMTIDKKTEIENFIQLQSIAINAENNIALADSIVSANVEFLFALASDTLVVESAQAQVLLEVAGLAEYPPVVYPPVIDNQKNIQITSPENSIVNPASEVLEIYPNPVKETLYVEYFLLDFESEENKYLEILSETGELIDKIQINNQAGIIQLNVRNYKPAIYLIRLNTTSYKFSKI